MRGGRMAMHIGDVCGRDSALGEAERERPTEREREKEGEVWDISGKKVKKKARKTVR